MHKSLIPCIAVGVAGLAFMGGSAYAGTATSTFGVDVTIVAQCLINSASTLSFGGSQGVLSGNVDQTSTIVVQCTDTTTYDIGLDEGTGTGASVATRKLTGSGGTINYRLYSNAGRTTVWGKTVSTDTVSGTGTGAAQTYTVYGRIPAQTTPAPATYSDTITITVTY
jgi:spore coat protein U-like protein